MTKALIIGGSPEGKARVVRALADSAQVVIAVDSGGALCLAAGVTPTSVVGDLDSLAASDLAALRDAGVPFEIHPAEKNVTDLDIAIDYARRAGTTRIVATGVLGARIDHSLGSIGTLARAADLCPSIEEELVSACVLDSRYRARVELSGEGTTVSVMAVCGSARVSVNGVHWPLVGAQIEPLSTLGVSNVLTASEASVEVLEGTVLVVAPTVGDLKSEFIFSE